MCTHTANSLLFVQTDQSDVSFKLLIELLNGIRRVLRDKATLKYHQRKFREVGCFIKIVNLITVEDREDRVVMLCMEVVQTLTALMAGNKKNKEHFSTNIGEQAPRHCY